MKCELSRQEDKVEQWESNQPEANIKEMKVIITKLMSRKSTQEDLITVLLSCLLYSDIIHSGPGNIRSFIAVQKPQTSINEEDERLINNFDFKICITT